MELKSLKKKEYQDHEHKEPLISNNNDEDNNTINVVTDKEKIPKCPTTCFASCVYCKTQVTATRNIDKITDKTTGNKFTMNNVNCSHCGKILTLTVAKEQAKIGQEIGQQLCDNYESKFYKYPSIYKKRAIYRFVHKCPICKYDPPLSKGFRYKANLPIIDIAPKAKETMLVYYQCNNDKCKKIIKVSMYKSHIKKEQKGSVEGTKSNSRFAICTGLLKLLKLALFLWAVGIGDIIEIEYKVSGSYGETSNAQCENDVLWGYVSGNYYSSLGYSYDQLCDDDNMDDYCDLGNKMSSFWTIAIISVVISCLNVLVTVIDSCVKCKCNESVLLNKNRNKYWKYIGLIVKALYYIMWLCASIAVIVIETSLNDCCSICDNDNDCESCDATTGDALQYIGFGAIVDVGLGIHDVITCCA